jgi:hypothetical protein
MPITEDVTGENPMAIDTGQPGQAICGS